MAVSSRKKRCCKGRSDKNISNPSCHCTQTIDEPERASLARTPRYWGLSRLPAVGIGAVAVKARGTVTVVRDRRKATEDVLTLHGIRGCTYSSY